MTSHFVNQIFPYLYAMTSFIFEDILVIGYDDKLKVIDSQYIGENNSVCTAGFNKEKLAQIMSDKKYKYLLIAHNHPDTTSKPSDDDVEFTKHICGLCQNMNVTFVDHIIVSAKSTSFFSFKNSHYYKGILPR